MTIYSASEGGVFLEIHHPIEPRRFRFEVTYWTQGPDDKRVRQGVKFTLPPEEIVDMVRLLQMCLEPTDESAEDLRVAALNAEIEED